MATPGRALRAAQPHIELTTTSVVPFASLSRLSTSSGVRISSTPRRVSSCRMGVMKRSSYIGASERGRIDGFELSLVFDAAVTDQGQDRALRDDEVRVPLERDLDGGLPEEEGVVAGAALHGNESRFAELSSPRLVAALAGVRHWKPRPGRDDLSALHGLAVHGGGRKVQTYLGPLLTLLDADEHAVADDDQALLVFFHWSMVARSPKCTAQFLPMTDD